MRLKLSVIAILAAVAGIVVGLKVLGQEKTKESHGGLPMRSDFEEGPYAAKTNSTMAARAFEPQASESGKVGSSEVVKSSAYVSKNNAQSANFVNSPTFAHQVDEISEDQLFEKIELQAIDQKIQWHASCNKETFFPQDMNAFLERLKVTPSLYPMGGVVLDWNRYFQRQTERVQLSANWQGDLNNPKYIVQVDISRSGSLLKDITTMPLRGVRIGVPISWAEAQKDLEIITGLLESEGYMAAMRTAVIAVEPFETNQGNPDAQAASHGESQSPVEDSSLRNMIQIQLFGEAVKTLRKGAMFCNYKDFLLCFCKTN